MSENPSFLYTVSTLFKRFMAEEIYTCFPAKITKYENGKAEIQPLVKRTYNNGEELVPEPIPNVPVVMPQTSNAIVKLPINEGDTGLGLCTKASLDSWLAGGDYAIQSISRQFEMSDVVFMVGLIPFGRSNLTGNNKDLEIIYKNSKISIKENGDVDINDGNLKVSSNG